MVRNITEVDSAVRRVAPGVLSEALAAPDADPVGAMVNLGQMVASEMGDVLEEVRWDLSPWHSLFWETSSMQTATLVRQYHFAAAHRLFDPSLDDATNESIFGKCARPGGHGHNYMLEVHLGVEAGHGPSPMKKVDELVESCVLERFDHRHLNNECPEFQTVNPTVENIAMVCWNLLQEPLSACGTPRQVRVWETDRTWAAFPAEPLAMTDA